MTFLLKKKSSSFLPRLLRFFHFHFRFHLFSVLDFADMKDDNLRCRLKVDICHECMMRRF